MKQLSSVIAMTLFPLPSEGKFQAKEICQMNISSTHLAFSIASQNVARKLVQNLNLLCIISFCHKMFRVGHIEMSMQIVFLDCVPSSPKYEFSI